MHEISQMHNEVAEDNLLCSLVKICNFYAICEYTISKILGSSNWELFVILILSSLCF